MKVKAVDHLAVTVSDTEAVWWRLGVESGSHQCEEGEHPLDFRIYAKAADGKTKNDHFQEMLLRAVSDKQVQATVLDSWYGSWQNLKLVDRWD